MSRGRCIASVERGAQRGVAVAPSWSVAARRARDLALAGALLAAASMALGCTKTTRLRPASGVERAASSPTAAVVSRGGLRLIADTEAWDAYPEDLEQVMTPILVRLLNDSDREVALRYPSFRLVTGSGQELRPMPPVQVTTRGEGRRNPLSAFGFAGLRAPVWIAPDGPRQRARGEREGERHGAAFHFAPYYRDLWGDGPRYWEHGFDFDPYYYDRYGQWRADLPTEAMVRRALPEGVLEPGGWISGFLYFEKIAATRVVLHADIELPLGEERVASMEIAFVDVGPV
jgi:hypothetical protein